MSLVDNTRERGGGLLTVCMLKIALSGNPKEAFEARRPMMFQERFVQLSTGFSHFLEQIYLARLLGKRGQGQAL